MVLVQSNQTSWELKYQLAHKKVVGNVNTRIKIGEQKQEQGVSNSRFFLSEQKIIFSKEYYFNMSMPSSGKYTMQRDPLDISTQLMEKITGCRLNLQM